MEKELLEGVCPENEKSLMNPKNTKDCSGCNGGCCKYVVIEIDKPEKLEDFDVIRWYVAHKNINVFVDEDDTWHVEFITSCEFLDDKHLCKIYDKRPQICRDFSAEDCPFHNEYCEKHTFRNLADLENFIEKVWKK